MNRYFKNPWAICPNARELRRDNQWVKNHFSKKTYRCPVDSCFNLFFEHQRCVNHRILRHKHKDIKDKEGNICELKMVECKKRGCKELYANKSGMLRIQWSLRF